MKPYIIYSITSTLYSSKSKSFGTSSCVVQPEPALSAAVPVPLTGKGSQSHSFGLQLTVSNAGVSTQLTAQLSTPAALIKDLFPFVKPHGSSQNPVHSA